jgi:hypothetical protein
MGFISWRLGVTRSAFSLILGRVWCLLVIFLTQAGAPLLYIQALWVTISTVLSHIEARALLSMYLSLILVLYFWPVALGGSLVLLVMEMSRVVLMWMYGSLPLSNLCKS